MTILKKGSVYSRLCQCLRAVPLFEPCRGLAAYKLPLLAGVVALLLAGCSHHMGGVLEPAGPVASAEKHLLMDATALMLIVVLPVILMSFVFAFRYRAKNKHANYQPNWSHNNVMETIWWVVPCIIVIILCVITWIQTHKLDPYRKLNVPGKPLLIEAVSLRWKWLFIYPKQHIATINEITFPKDKQVTFWITSDAPMSAFFIPQLGSQIYSMAGMRTRLHLLASRTGVYEGLNTQFNGEGFSDMHFKVRVTNEAGYHQWLDKVRQAKLSLDIPEYQKIVKPTIANPVEYFSAVKPGFFNRIMEQYTKPNMRMH